MRWRMWTLHFPPPTLGFSRLLIHHRTPMISVRDISHQLQDIANLLEMSDESPFKVRAYRVAAECTHDFVGPLERFLEQAHAKQLKGIGPQLLSAIEKLAAGESLLEIEPDSIKVPLSLLGLLSLPGIGPKKARSLFTSLEVSTVEALEVACKEGKVEQLKGWGAKAVAKVLEGIAQQAQYRGKLLLSKAEIIAEELKALLADVMPAAIVEISGQVRRKLEVVDELHFVICGVDIQQFTQGLESRSIFVELCCRDKSFSAKEARTGIRVGASFCQPSDFAMTLFESTGSQEHVASVKARIAPQAGKVFNSEDEIYWAADCAVMPPELREEAVDGSATAPLLVTQSEIKGIIHCHTTYSDGSHTLREMAEAARDAGFEYIGISDHSRTAVYARGLSINAIAAQHLEIDELNAKLAPFKIFKGIESDILNDGSLDYPDEVLARFDFAIASVHSNFGLSREQQTERIIAAVKNPYTTILAHPTGRLLLSREGYQVDLERVIQAAAECGVVIEINCNPRRLDMDWRWWKLARSLAVRTSINPDAHSIGGFADICYGVSIARKGGLGPDQVINCLALPEFQSLLDRRASSRGLAG